MLTADECSVDARLQAAYGVAERAEAHDGDFVVSDVLDEEAKAKV